MGSKRIRVAINGAGRIGRAVFRAFFEYPERFQKIELVGLNDPHEREVLLHLLKYDTVHGKFPFSLSLVDQGLCVDKKLVPLFQTREISELPWAKLDVDVVLECTGRFKSQVAVKPHLDAGAKRVIISAPGADDVDTTMVLGANEMDVDQSAEVVSIGSCSTNALAPVLRVIQDKIAIESGFVTTVHAYTKDQSLVDSHHKDLRRARAAACSIIPTKTGAAKAIGKVLPALQGKLDGYALRVPTANVSVLDISLVLNKPCSRQDLITWLTFAAHQDKLDILAVTDEPLVSCDFNHHQASCVVDLLQVQVIGNMVKLVVWYDNEWGFANRMLDAVSLLNVSTDIKISEKEKEYTC